MKPQLHFLVALIDLYGSRTLMQITPTATAWDEAIAEILEMHRGLPHAERLEIQRIEIHGNPMRYKAERDWASL